MKRHPASPFALDPATAKRVTELDGPILVFGAGGFIGLNLLRSLLLYRDDVYGISQDPNNNWRFLASETPRANLRPCDIREAAQIQALITELKPRTIFNLAAYGAYSKQQEYKKIYVTNFISHVDLIEHLKPHGFSAYLYAGSSSEYGLNSAAPAEGDELVPNSHYAVSKTAAYYACKYYGKTEKLPVAHLRLYSAFGPWEEPDRLVPVLLARARAKSYPPLVDPDITRDFIYSTDITAAFVAVAAGVKPERYGEVYNVGTGIKTTIRELALLTKNICGIAAEPAFGNMQNRAWDMPDWFSDSSALRRDFGWEPRVSLEEGLRRTLAWQQGVGYDTASWNWTKDA
jgi:dolichol-phosphate mannosyltransferase